MFVFKTVFLKHRLVGCKDKKIQQGIHDSLQGGYTTAYILGSIRRKNLDDSRIYGFDLNSQYPAILLKTRMIVDFSLCTMVEK